MTAPVSCLPARIATMAVALISCAPLAEAANLRVGGGGVSATSANSFSAGRSYAARPGESVELVAPDGTSIVLGSGASVAVEAFSWNGSTGAGSLQLRLGAGTFRISAGRLGRGGRITLRAGPSTVQIDRATAVISYGGGGLRTYMTVGDRVTVSSAGCSRSLVRPGFETVVQGGCPTRARRISSEQLASDQSALRPTRFVAASGTAQAPANTEGNQIISGRRDAAFFSTLRPERRPETGRRDREPRDRREPGVVTPPPVVPPAAQPDRNAFQLALALAPGIGTAPSATPNVSASPASISDSGIVISGQVTTQSQSESFRLFPSVERQTRSPGPTTNRVISAPTFEAGLVGPLPGLIPPQELSDELIVNNDKNQFIYRTDDGDGPESSVDIIFDTPSVELSDFNLFGRSLSPNELNDVFGIITAGFAEIELSQAFPEGSFGKDVLTFNNTNTPLDGLRLIDIWPEVVIDASTLSEEQLGSLGITPDAPLGSVYDGVSVFSVVYRELDNFVYFQRTSEDQGSVFLFAAGDVDGVYSAPSATRLDRFFTSAGLTDYQQRDSAVPIPDGLRAFLPAESAFATRSMDGSMADPGLLSKDFVDSGVFLAYRPNGPDAFKGASPPDGYQDGEVVAQMVHADLGIDGAGPDQRSTLSVTLGQVERHKVDSDLPGDAAGSFDAFLLGHTFGSSRDNTAESDGKSAASIFFSSPLASSSAGGGNPDLVDPVSKQPLTGTPGYFVVENYDPSDGDPGGGLSRPLAAPDAEPEPRYATLRLLSATGSLSKDSPASAREQFAGVDLNRRTSSLRLEGFAAGLSEFQAAGIDGIGVAFADGFTSAGGGTYRSNLTIGALTGTNRLWAELALSDPSGVSRVRQLGGPKAGSAGWPDTPGTSAYLDDFTFAARTEPDEDGGGTALVAAPLVTSEAKNPQGEPEEVTVPGLGKVRKLKHLAWGVFLGDRVWDEDGDLREHIHLGAWVAGDPVDRDRYQNFTGSATYRGHAIGNAYDGKAISTELGSFRNTWDFAKDTGKFDMDFDGRSYSGDTRFKRGRGFISDNLKSTGRLGRIDGDFYGPVTGGSPAAVGGQFAISSTKDSGPYRASGIFAGEK